MIQKAAFSMYIDLSRKDYRNNGETHTAEDPEWKPIADKIAKPYKEESRKQEAPIT